MSEDFIIEKPALQSPMQRLGWGFVTFIFWMVYIYLWLPLITLAAWWIGYKLFKIHFIDLQGYAGLKQQMGLYLLVIFTISLVLIGWAMVERKRFKNVHRRHGKPDLTVSEAAKTYHMEDAQLVAYRDKKSMVVHLSGDGNITDVTDYVTET